MDDLRAGVYGQPKKDPRLNSRPPRWGVIVIIGLIVLVLIVLAVGSYLSRKPVSVPTASPQATSASMSPVEETNIGIATTTHGSSDNTYTNSTYNFQIQYPSFMQEVPAVSSTVPFVPVCSDGDILCLEYPPDHLPNVVNFEGAALAVDVYSGYTSETSCDDLSDSVDDPGSVTTTIINGNLFATGVSRDAATGHSLNGALYRTFHDSSCYAIYFGVGTYRCDSGKVTVDANNNITACNGQPTASVLQVEQQMNAVVSSFKFL